MSLSIPGETPASGAVNDRLSRPLTEGVRTSPPAGKALMPSIGIVNTALIATLLGVTVVLLPNQVALIDDANKVTNLAIVSSVTLLITLLAQPIIGAFSDRTRSRFGRRAPWMFIGLLVMAMSTVSLGSVQTIAFLVGLVTLFQLGFATISAPLAALTADRYPPERRGMVSAFIGFGLNVGYAVGVFIAGNLAANVNLAYTIFGIGAFVVGFAFILVARDSSSLDMPVKKFRWTTFLLSFWINPLKNPDFAWAFVARFLFILGYYVVFGYQFFILIDYLALDLDGANSAIAVLGLVALPPTLIGAYVTGWLSDRWHRRKPFLYAACVAMAAGFMSQYIAPTMTGQVIMVILTGIGFGMYLASDTALMTQVLPDIEGAAAKDLGILNLATGLPQALSAIVAATIITSFGGYSGLFIFATVIVIVGAIAVIPIRSVR